MAYKNLPFHRNPDGPGHISQRITSPGFALANMSSITWHQLFKVCFGMATFSAAINTFSDNAAGRSLQDFRFAFRHVKSNDAEVFLCQPLMQKYTCENTKKGRRGTCLQKQEWMKIGSWKMVSNLICWNSCPVKVRGERSPISFSKDLVKLLQTVVHQDSLC